MKRILFITLLFIFSSNIYAEDFGPISSRKASKITTNTSDFDNNLSNIDTNVQVALDTLDDATVAVFGLWQLDADGNMMPIVTTATDTYWELDTDNNLMPEL